MKIRKTALSNNTLSQTFMFDLPLAAFQSCQKPVICSHLQQTRSCSCEQPFTFRLTFRNGCIRNSLRAPYSSSTSTWFPLFLWNIFLLCCKFCVNSRYHSWNGKYQWHGWFPSPFIFPASSLYTVKKFETVCKDVFKPFTAPDARQPSIREIILMQQLSI